jgi:hypothetical protein
MARPTKKGLCYFPLDVAFRKDEKIIKLQFQHGAVGVYVYILILCLIYEQGYYLEMSLEDLAVLLMKEINGKKQFVSLNKIQQVIHCCVQYDLFDKSLVRNNVITAVSIQKQYLMSTKRRADSVIDKYNLLDDKNFCTENSSLLNTSKKEVNVGNNEVIAYNNSINVDNNEQSKSKIDKLDKLKIKSIGSPILNYYTTVLIDNNFISLYDLDIAEYNYFLGELATHYNYRKILSAIKYTIAEIKKRQDNIDDKFAYFKKSILNGLERLDNLEKPIEKNLNKLFGFEEEQ